MHPLWKDELQRELIELERMSLKRELREVQQAHQPWLSIKDQPLLNLASNNYLGLAGDERLEKAGIEALKSYSSGATASRLIIGNHPLYARAEQALCEWKGIEGGLILNSGYTANMGIISSLMGRHDAVFSDRLNHASIVDGISLSRAEHLRYRHNDLEHLESLLKKSSHRRKLIVTDSVFSMDGDQADLCGLVTLKERYGALLMVDEAHSSGLYGQRGEGLVHSLGLKDRVDIGMGTFSKALGCFGAYVVGEKWLIQYLINKMRSFIYTTGLPPAVLGSITAAIDAVRLEQDRRKLLFQHSQFVRTELARLGFTIGEGNTPIIPIITGTNEITVRFSGHLQEEGIAAIAIRPPTVPNNQARIRLTIMATHQRKDLQWAIEKLSKIGRALGVIS